MGGVSAGLAEFAVAVAFEAEGGGHDGDGGDGPGVVIEDGSGDAVDAFEAFGEFDGVAALAGFEEVGFERGAGGEGVGGVGFECDRSEVGIELGLGERGEDGFAGGAREHGDLEADGAADFDGLAGDALLEDGDLVVRVGEELSGFAGGIAEPFEGVEGAEDEAFFADVGAGEVEEFVGQDEAFVVFAALEVAALLKGGGDAGDGVDGEVEVAGDFGEIEAEAVLAEEFEDGEGALGSGGLGAFAEGCEGVL